MSEKRLKIHVAHPGHYCSGAGDVITWAWIADGPVKLEFYAEGRNREMLELLGCRISDSPAGAIDPHDAYNKELGERCARPRIEIWCDFLGIPCEPKRPKVAIEKHRPMNRRVALCPHTHYHVREWPPAYWMDLNWELRNRNMEVIWLMEHDDKQYSERGPSMSYHGYGMRDVASMMGSSTVIVANDSMPAHLGGTIGRPTFAMMGPTNRNVFAHMVDVMPMHSEVSKCAGCHFGHPFRAACDMMCQALMTLTPQEVADTIEHSIETLNNAARRIPADLPTAKQTRDRNQCGSA